MKMMTQVTEILYTSEKPFTLSGRETYRLLNILQC